MQVDCGEFKEGKEVQKSYVFAPLIVKWRKIYLCTGIGKNFEKDKYITS